MRYLITLICLVFATNCASLNKAVSSAPDQGPTQEEILQQLELKQQTKVVEEWWAEEVSKIKLHFLMTLGLSINFELEKIHFFDDYDLALLEIEATFKEEKLNCYIILTPTSSGWAFGHMLLRKPGLLTPELMENEEGELNDNEL